ncbi:hypothetical protein GGH94_002236 [Coemansia aciculifera]|uniref:EF-hand n=2 Tax=Coemansia TaxID=4863 RepID=A0A9W8IR26_9FUNG|nr:hypothetical protein GGH94_002236 [Coemansia aciculifera]KAJ2875075.1 hypothetical protein GGH93_001910 [Coemansia aciculifera]
MSDTGLQPRLSVAALGLLAGLGALWVYAALRRRNTVTSRRGPLRRTRTIRRPRRAPAAVVSELSSAESSDNEAGTDGASSGASSEEEEEGIGSSDMRMLHVLCTVAEDQARRSSVIHRSTACNSCQESPIRGVRFRCAQCADVDICERCEAHDAHRHHALLKISVPLPPLSTTRMPLLRTPFHTGAPTRELPRDANTRALERLLGRGELASLHATFCAISNGESLSRVAFLSCLGPFAGSLLASRLFAFYDADGDGVLVFEELARGVAAYSRGAVAEKSAAVFRAYDVDGDGKVSREDMRRVLDSCAEVNRELTRAAVRALEDDVIEDPSKLLSGQPVSAAFSATIPADSTEPLSATKPKDSEPKDSGLKDVVELKPGLVPVTMWHDVAEDDAWPAMDALSRDAVRMMLNDIFVDAAPADPDFLSHEEFRAYLKRNPSLFSYIEVLGPIF